MQVRHIFGRIASLYSDALAATMDSLLPRGEAWEERRRANVLFILQVRGGGRPERANGLFILQVRAW